MKKLIALSLVASGVLFTHAAIAQPSDEIPSVETTAIKGDLYLLQGKGGNVVASVGDSGVLIIDDDYAEYGTAYEDALTDLAGADATPKYVINTHWHGDHTGGNEYWGQRGAVIVAQDNVRIRLATRQEKKNPDRVVEPSPAIALPVVTFGDSMALHFNNDDIEVQHYPKGHTDGDSAIFFTAANVAHMGDHFFKDRFPFVDIGSGGSVSGYITNVKALLQRVDAKTVVIPGHGDIADKADFERFLNMLETTSALVGDKLKQGMSVDAITEQGLGDEWASWGSGFIDEASWISWIADSR